jgi:dipeptidyl aminopeptidase/acylaminoacyl peptidase
MWEGMMRTSVLAAFALAISTSAFPQNAGARHPFAFDDWAALRDAVPVAVSPDGKTILSRVDSGVAKGKTHHEWKVVGSDGMGARTLELPEHFTPSGFTRDGSLYGSYDVNKVGQLAIVPMNAGVAASTPARIIPLPRGMHSAHLSPDGARFAILATPGEPDSLSDVRTVIEPEQTSLYVVGADGTGGAWWCPELKRIADGPISGGVMAWSRDSSAIALVSQTPKIGFKDLNSTIDICGASGARRVAEIANAVSGLAWNGDGRTLAFLSTTTNVLTPDHVWTVAAVGGTPVDRTPSLAGSAMQLGGDAHGHVWVLVAHGVQNEIDAFDNGTLTPLYRWPAGSLMGLPIASDLASSPQQVALAIGDPLHAIGIAVPAGDSLRRITSEGDDITARIDLGTVRVVKWTSKESIRLEGIATFPAGYQEGRRYPFLVLPHGGPEGNDLLVLDPFARMVAGLGYVVLQPQYRGSTGYGSDFLQAIYQHFGDRAYRDVDSATDYAVAEGWADPNRLAIFGWSAGGFMTSWTITQTNRYRAAIEGAGITDWASFVWTSDVQQWDYDARWPEKDPQAFAQFSAVAHAERVSTPLLVLHGEADERVPTYQGREFYEALAARGKTTRMVTYPGSGHFPALWEQRRDVFRELAAWLARYNPASGS